MNSDATVTFMVNTDPLNPVILPEETLFSIPYAKILQAQEFCKDEELEYCFVGYSNYDWHVKGVSNNLDPVVKINDYGIHPDTLNQYVYCLTKDSE